MIKTEARTVYWTVTVYDRYGSVHHSTALHASAAVHHHEFWSLKPSTARVGFTEHTLVQASALATFADLPGSGERTPLPGLPAGAFEVKRFFRFARVLEDGSLTGHGPAVLCTGDDVRYFYEWTVQTQGHAHAVHVDVSTLRILDITLTHYTRDVQLHDLPDDFTTSLVGGLESEGLGWISSHEKAGPCLRVPLADASEITISGTPADEHKDGSGCAEAAPGEWLAVWVGAGDGAVEVYRPPRRIRTRAADTAALTAAVIKYARQHGGAPVLRDEPRQSRA
ncbi:hypothetical protein AB0E08_42075 [Streptomyces sp. NPDC048281]|uniref:hypothetical protein n=1 Tax=Streptomyces sp. NPDC048281 TaxID=3154715 RepID=UPI0034199B42